MVDDELQGFADAATLKARYSATSDAFLLGLAHPDHEANFPVGIDDDRHLFIMAGSRAGKGTSMIIPNLLHWQGGVFCIDPKGENASITAMRRGTKDKAKGTGTSTRHFLGQNVAILDPMNIVRGAAKIYRVSYDPLADIDVGTDDEVDQILSIGEAIVMADGGKDSHWSDNARTILVGIIEAVLHSEKDTANHSLAFCRSIFQRGMKDVTDAQGTVIKEGVEAYLEGAPETDGGLAKDAYALLQDAGEDEAGSFSTTLSRQLQFLANPKMQKHLKNDGFSLAQAVRENWSIYVCLPPAQIARMKRWMRALVRVALEAKMHPDHKHHGQQSLFLLDEFYSLGKMKEIEESAAYMAGYGIKLVPVIQNIGQVEELYDKNWETFLGNAGAIIAWGLNDHRSEKYISDRLGNVLRWEISKSAGSSTKAGDFFAASTSENLSTALHERPVRRPNEVHTDGARDEYRAFIVPASSEPFMVQRIEYFRQWQNDQIYDDPAFIDTWEAEYGTYS